MNPSSYFQQPTGEGQAIYLHNPSPNRATRRRRRRREEKNKKIPKGLAPFKKNLSAAWGRRVFPDGIQTSTARPSFGLIQNNEYREVAPDHVVVDQADPSESFPPTSPTTSEYEYASSGSYSGSASLSPVSTLNEDLPLGSGDSYFDGGDLMQDPLETMPYTAFPIHNPFENYSQYENPTTHYAGGYASDSAAGQTFADIRLDTLNQNQWQWPGQAAEHDLLNPQWTQWAQ
ncbi:hypothetical protein FA15DRAFT_652441 [Coprinopsis marcescibilis]|uniref:Uncharacterized protein n=1 Tax=Coprinopsis marcescibilis TaxID=230819 RepID=A0A5C3L8K4_COPMA|nr:hypothetical protein FA15DRAFT_652441 [Coprinopsis marcescibilis]